MKSSLIAKKIFNCLNKISKKKIHNLHEPYFFNSDISSNKKCLKSTFVSTYSQVTNKIENELCKYAKSKYSVATNNGTSALHLALISIGIKKGDEIILPNFNFIASANAALYCQGIPHFLDIENESFGLDPNYMELYLKKNSYKKNGVTYNKKSGNPIKAIIPTHVFGNSCKIIDIIKVAKKYNLKVIEDASEALGSFYKNKHLGTFGDIGILSFNGNKIITTGAGGAVLTNNQKIYKKILHISKVSKISNTFSTYDEIGYNYRMPGLNASLGISQLRNIKLVLKIKKKIYKNYEKNIGSEKNFQIIKPIKNSKSNNWLVSIFLNKSSLKLRDKVIKKCHKNKVYVRPAWKLMNKIKHLKNFQFSKINNSIIAEKSIINLPSSLNILKKKK